MEISYGLSIGNGKALFPVRTVFVVPATTSAVEKCLRRAPITYNGAITQSFCFSILPSPPRGSFSLLSGSPVLPSRIQSSRSKGKERVHKDRLPARLRLQGKRSCSPLVLLQLPFPLKLSYPAPFRCNVHLSSSLCSFLAVPVTCRVNSDWSLALSKSAWKWEERLLQT